MRTKTQHPCAKWSPSPGSKNFNIELQEVIFGCSVTNTYDDDTMSPDVDMKIIKGNRVSFAA